MKLFLPLPEPVYITQDFLGHIARAEKNNWCPTPDPNCPSGIYYFPAIDYGVKEGTPVYATMDGTVAVASIGTTGYGTYIKLSHDNNLLSVYGHLSKLLVSANNNVSCGQIIGLSGNTGFSSGPHLHFELRENNIPFDPQPYIVTECEDTPPIEIPVLPELVQGKVIAYPSLNVRNTPSIAGRRVGSLKPNTIIDLLRYYDDGNYWWVQIGYEQYCCIKEDNNWYIKFL